jgi:hypothetical protein
MKKTLVAVAVMGLMITTAPAFLYINWSTYPGVINPDSSALFPDDTTPALFQLIFTPDVIQGDALPGGAVSGNDTILQQFTVTYNDIGGGDYWASTYSVIYGLAPFQAGYVYVRVFQAGTSIGNVPVGALYVTGPLFPTIDNPGPPTVPDFIDLGPGGSGPYGEYMLNQVVVPEPTVLALAALGAGVVAVRRFRRS